MTRPLHPLATVSARQSVGLAAPAIVQYLNNRDFSSSAIGPDSGPEVIDFVPAGHSPTGRDLVVVANEITGTVSIYTAVVP